MYKCTKGYDWLWQGEKEAEYKKFLESFGEVEPTLPEFETQLKVRGKEERRRGGGRLCDAVCCFMLSLILSLTLSLSLFLSLFLTLPLSLSPLSLLKHFVNVEAEIAGIASEHVIGALALNTTNLKLQFSQSSEEWKVTYKCTATIRETRKDVRERRCCVFVCVRACRHPILSPFSPSCSSLRPSTSSFRSRIVKTYRTMPKRN